MDNADRISPSGAHEHYEKSFAALKRFRPLRRALEACEICARELGPGHPHLIEPAKRRIVCACQACALLFDDAQEQKYRRIPRDAFLLPTLQIDAVDWESLGIPIGLAFFLTSSATHRVAAIYPSPGGAAETEPSLDAWNAIARRHARVERLRPDVEALLVNRLGGASECYVAPVDLCYELTGLLRKYWTGFTGGDEVWAQVAHFFDHLRRQAIILGAMHAGSAV